MENEEIIKENNIIFKKKYKYKCIFNCPITINDCINSIDLKEDKVIIGTLMGDVYLCRVEESKLYPKNDKKIEIPHLKINKIKDKEEDISNIQLNKKLDSIKLSVNNIENNKIKSQKKDYIKFPQITPLIIRSRENIPCLEFESNDIINISIGDLEIIHLENMSNFNKNDKNSTYNFSKLRNYRTENEHIEYCESATCMLKNSCFLLIFTKFGEFNDKLEISEIKYENKNLITSEIIKSTMYLSNFVIPFDFDGDLFLFLDFKTKKKRMICVEYTFSLKKKYSHIILEEENFGHISHMKLLAKDKILMVRNGKVCEIRYLNENLDVIEKWEHLGDEIINICFYKNKTNELLIDLIENENYHSEEINKSKMNNKKEGDIIEFNSVTLFKNKIKDINHKEKEKALNHLISTNQTAITKTNNNYNKSRMKKNNKMNESSLLVKVSKINTSLEYNNKANNNILLQTETSMKRKRNNINNNNLYNINSIESSTSRKKFNTADLNKIINKEKYNKYKEEKTKNNIKKNIFSSIEIYEKNSKVKKDEKIIENKSYENKTIINDKEDNINNIILALDINGGIYFYNNDSQILLFNIYDIENIDIKFKNLQFFSMGFPYYIIANDDYICITSDHGLFVFSKNDK